jgi:hypothetical protein
MSLDLDTAVALLAVLVSAAFLLRGALAGVARFLALGRGGAGPRICKGCGGGGCKASSAPGPARVVLRLERIARGS